MRDSAGLTIEAAAKLLECSTGRVSLIETGGQSTRPKAVREMAQVYGVTDQAVVTELEDLARQSGEKGWWAGYEDVLPDKLVAYIDLETDARELLDFSSYMLHGLLQTADYARAVNRATTRPGTSADQVERLTQLRVARQERLSGDRPLVAWFVLDEAALRRPVGGAQVMRDQLSRLLELSGEPNITIQVLPFAKGEHASLDGAFTVLRFHDPASDPDVVYTEGPAGSVYLEDIGHVRELGTRFDQLRVLALDQAESRAFIEAIRRETTS